MKRFLIYICLVLSIDVHAQYQFVKQWDYRYGGTSDEIMGNCSQLADSSFLIGGMSFSGISGDKSQSSIGGTDFWILKVNSLGQKQWDKRFGGIGDEGFATLIQTCDGGILIGGNSNSDVSGDKTDSTRGSSDFWIIKTDSAGNKEWDKCFGGPLTDYLSVIVQCPDKGYLLGGTSNSGIGGDKTQENWDHNHFFDDGWLIKIDSLGNKQWDRNLGGTNQDGIISVITTNDNGFLVGCYSNSDSSGDKTQTNWGGSDYWIVKIDVAGNTQWNKRYGGLGYEFFGSLVATNNGYVLSGQSMSDSSGDKTQNRFNYSADCWLIKIDTLGNNIWDKTYGGGANEEYVNIVNTNDGGFLISSRSYSNASGDKTESNLAVDQGWLVKVDSIGNKQWDKTIFLDGSSDVGYAVQTNDGCYLYSTSNSVGISGYKSVLNWNNSSDYWVLKFCMEPFNGIGEPNTKGDLNSRVQVWPNPFANDLSIALTGGHTSTANFTITNAAGQVVYQQAETNLAPGYTKMLDLSYLPNGVYFVEVTTSEGKAVKRVVKQ